MKLVLRVMMVHLGVAVLLVNAAGGAPSGGAARPGKDMVVAAKPAAPTEKPPARWAVLVGIGYYEDDSIPALQFSCADVRALQATLIDPKVGGVPKENVALLSDDAADPKLKPTRLNVLARLRSWANLAGPKDTLLFFFSGHGIAEKGKGYLLPADARVGLLSDSAIPTARVDELMADSKCQNTVMILDACHSAAGKDLAVMSAEFSQELFSDAEGRVTMASCQESQQSFEWKEKGHGVYTYFLLEGMSGKADANRDGCITVTELNAYAHDRVVRWAAENNREQEPRARMNIAGDILLARALSAPGGAVAGASPNPPVTPLALPARLLIQSEPAGARVLVNAKAQGETPCEVSIPPSGGKPRKVQVIVEKEGYRSQGLEMDLAGGAVIPLEVELERAPAPMVMGGAAAMAPGSAGPADEGQAPPEEPPAAVSGVAETVTPGTEVDNALWATPQGAQLKVKRLFDALKAMDAGRPECRLTRGQKAQLARILWPLRGRDTISAAGAEALVARIRPLLREAQKVDLRRRLSQPPSPEERRQAGRLQKAPWLLPGRARRMRSGAEPRPLWHEHPLFGQLSTRRR